MARHHIETTSRTRLAICDQYSDYGSEEAFRQTLQRHLNAWNEDRLHRTVDYLIQHGTPPPVESPEQLRESMRPMSLELAKLTHRQVCAENDVVLVKTDFETNSNSSPSGSAVLSDAVSVLVLSRRDGETGGRNVLRDLLGLGAGTSGVPRRPSADPGGDRRTTAGQQQMGRLTK